MLLLLAACSPLSAYPDCGVSIDLPDLYASFPLAKQLAEEWVNDAYLERADISIELTSDLGNPYNTSFIFHSEQKRPAALLIFIDHQGNLTTQEVSGPSSSNRASAVTLDLAYISSQEVFEGATTAACSLLGHDSIDRVLFTLIRPRHQVNPEWRVAFSKVEGGTVYATLDALTGGIIEVKG